MLRFYSWWFLFLIPLLIFLFLYAKKKRALKFSGVKLLRAASAEKIVKHKIGKAFVFFALLLLIVALARPQTTFNTDFIQRQGIDIAMILDVSGSMQSVDFEPNRMEVARKKIDDFIAARTNDRISLIVFAGEAFTRIPLTLDHNIVRESLSEVTTDSVNIDGTAIGMAISVGLNRLKKSDSPSRIMILLTDGENNAGAIDPLTAGKLAQDLGIKIYTVGVGSDKTILPVQVWGQTQYQQVQGGIDEELLTQIANLTGGQYFRAADPDALSNIFETINLLEKTGFDDDNLIDYNELAFPLIQAALFFLLAGIFFDKFYFVQIP
ncbi:MAG: VWA domain-containing protein [Defluviitaleaceae bacterium]|nr:VWA domain-containing protein [Defluviitaleaceae bacterium]